MKKKLFIISMGVLCATQLMHSNNAKASISENALSKSEKYTEITSEEKVAFVEQTQVGKYKTSNDLNLVDFDMYTTGGKSGAMVGYSEIDSSHFTDRDKRVIRREHVKEAQSLIYDYKYTHKYEDLAKATSKVNTLGESHQKYLNKQIDKVNNQIEKSENR
ncbi:TPA: hypothetical protein ACGI1V_002624 [Staphylococcus argenteus]|uniref:von Willebrand binding protein n=1 Tax=Staphylococcus argenteus TaxID=985002 RepID=A0A7U7JTB5_9STAP|nr:hypothetical protein [Staphylococcus argenteus]BBN30223.1 anaerobic ribonucleoside-triphosphate reductase activating protein [Staphylococcus aureus]ATY56423.1 hypothetical protein CJ017_03910 [Staphylococcus argenteus]ATZ86665.1 hypothetical protein CKO49_03925 [Staphylococcus argenteus]EKF1504907.1 hypothetical protein [Staphylococcus argenteus]EYG83416.1 hypothetical protein V676_02615 [Staphylococcus argenteus]